jgi:hypothetical protein
MKKIAIKISAFLFLFMLFTSQVSFASVWDKETVISPPVGVDVLPGAGFETEDIKEYSIFSKIIPFVIDYAVKAAIALSVIMLIFGGYQFMTAYGATEKQDNARRTITYAIIGLVIALTAYGIIAIITSIKLA